jgi:HlyD family secretion protein
MNRQKGNPRRHPAVIWSRVKWRWPFLVWVGAIVLLVYLLDAGGRFQSLQGVVDVDRRELSPLETARLRSLGVKSGERVYAGTVVAEMDMSLYDAQMQIDRLQVDRQFSRSIQGLESELRDVKLRRATEAAELSALNEELTRMQDLIRRGMVDSTAAIRLRSRQSALKESVRIYPEIVAELESELTKSRVMKDSIGSWLGETSPDIPEGLPVEAASELSLHRERLGMLRLRQETYTLRALRDGIVSRIIKEPGEVVQAGEAIMTIVYDGTSSVTGFLPEFRARELTVGDTAYLMRAARFSRAVPAVVTHLGPEILALPGRVSPIPGRTLRGRRVVLEPRVEHSFLPGETVSIHIDKPAWWGLIGGGSSEAVAQSAVD